MKLKGIMDKRRRNRMSIKNKIDFAVIFTVKNANPNGDPLNGNRPRINYDGYGEVSDVCIKRKIRNVWMYNDRDIFVQSNDIKVDEYKSLAERKKESLADYETVDELRKLSCQKWLDVRSFGQLFAFKGDSLSLGIRGPVSIHSAVSVNPIAVSSMQITKSVNSEDKKGGKASDTMGMKHRVDYGVYVFYGSISPQLAEKTGFDEEDAKALKEALVNLFYSDASSARPEGSMEVRNVYWWEHNSKAGQYSSAKVHRSLNIKANVKDIKNFDEVEIFVENLEGLNVEIIEGM